MNSSIEKIERNYRDWLIESVGSFEDKNYAPLLRELYRREFYSLVKYDEDRGSDGIALRGNWAELHNVDSDGLNFGPCKVLEVLIGISQRIEFQLFGSQWAEEWDYKKVFWHLLDNLNLLEYEGILKGSEYETVIHICDAFCARKYKCDGFGNIFRIFDSEKDVRKMNLWTQMGLYIRQKWPI